MAIPKTKVYKNIPVSPETYERVQLVSEANGFGPRGMGAQVAHWVGQELPNCAHPKVAVSIETFPSETALVQSVTKIGYYCDTCKRVYAKISPADLVAQDATKLLPVVLGRAKRTGAK